MERKHLNVFIISILFLGLLTLASILYYRADAVDRASELTYQRLLDSAKEQSLTLNAKMGGQYAILEMFADSLTLKEYQNKSLMLKRMNSVLSSSTFLHMGFIRGDGTGFLNEGQDIDVSDRAYFQRGMAGQRSVERVFSSKIGKSTRFIVAIPLVINGKTVGIIYGSYNEKMLRDLIVPHVFEGKGASYICDSKGNIIISSNAESYMFGKGKPLYGMDNVLEGYAKTKPLGDSTIADIRKNFAEGRRGVYRFSFQGYTRYIIYEPLPINDWFLISGVAGGIVDEAVAEAAEMPMLLFVLMALCMIVIILIILKWESRNRRILAEEEARLRISEEKYRIASEQSGNHVVLFDIKTKTIYQDFGSNGLFGSQEAVDNVPESNIESGIIEPESVDEYRRFYDAILSGERRGSAIVRMKDVNDGKSKFYQCNFTAICDTKEDPLQAVISFDDITAQREQELAYELWQQSVSAIPKDKIIIFEHNLTHDVLENVSGGMKFNDAPGPGLAFNSKTMLWASKNVYIEDFDDYVNFLNIDRLLNSYYSGHVEDSMQFRIYENEKNALRWLRLSVRMAEYPGTHDVKAFMIYEDINEKKLDELAMEERLQQDSLTGVLNRKFFEDKVNSLLKKESGLQHAIFMIDLDNFKQVNDTYGHAAGDSVLIAMSKALKAVLRVGDIVGRIGGDEFMICLKNIPYTEAIEKRAGFICELMKIEIAKGVFTSGSLGISLYPRDGMNFDELYKCADIAVYKAKEKGRCRFEFYSPNMRNSVAQRNAATPIDNFKLEDGLSGVRKQQMEEVIAYNAKLLQRQKEDERFRIFMERREMVSAEYDFKTKTFVATESFYKYQLSQQSGAQLFSKKVDISGVHPDDRVLYREQLIKESFGTKTDMQVALRLKLIAGEYVWCRLTVIHIRDAEGSIERSIGVIAREDALKNQSYVQLEALTRYVPAGTALLEVEEHSLTPIYISESMKCMTGLDFSANAYSFDYVRELFYPEEREGLFADFYESVISGNLFERTVRMRLHGEKGWGNIRAVRIPYEESAHPVSIAILTDVTEIKEKEEELRVERERMDIAFANTTINFWDFIYDGAKIIQTKSSQDIHGYPTVIENVPQSLIDMGCIYHDDVEPYRELYQKLADGAKNVSGIFRIKVENADKYQYEHIRYANIFDKGGRPVRAVGFSEWINMAYIGLAGDSVMNMNEVVSTLAISKLIGIFKVRMDADFTVIYGNEYYYNLHGYEDRQDMARSIELKSVRYVHPDYLRIIRNDIDSAIAAGEQTHRFEMRIITKQGDQKMVMVWGAFVDDSDGKCLLGGVIDETELYEQKERLNNQTLMLSTAVKHADLYYWVYDPKQSAAYYCQRLQDELHLPEIMANFPNSLFERNVIDREYRERFAKLHEDLKNGIPEVEADILFTSGSWYRFKYRNVFDEHGRPIKAMGTAQKMQLPLSAQLKIGRADENNEERTARAHLDYIFEMSAIETFEVDIKTHEATFSKGTVSKYKIASIITEDVPESLILSGLIHDDSIDSYRKFYADIYAGKPNGSTIINLKRAKGQYTLVKISYRMVYDEDNCPYKAIGISEEVENIADSRLRFEQEEKLYLLIKYDLVCLVRVNLSKDKIIHFDAPGCAEMKFDCGRAYEEFFQEISSRLSGLGESEDFNNKYSAEALSSLYKNGTDWLYNEYRLCKCGGSIDWVSISCQILTNPYNGDLYAFIYIRTIDERKKRELSLPFKAELDTTCSMYKRNTMKAIVNKVVRESKDPKMLCALAIIKIANLNTIIERFGPLSVDRLMISVNRKLRYTLVNRHPTYRTAENSIVIFMDNIESESALYEFGEYILQILNKPAFFTTTSEQYAIYQTGAAMVAAENVDFDKLLVLAQSATDKADMLKPHVQYYQDATEMARNNATLLPQPSESSPLSLSAAANNECSAYLFILCAEILLSNDDTEAAVNGVLEQIGKFFGADRAYVIEVNERKKSLNNTYEWCASGVSAQIDKLKDVPWETVPSFMRVYKEKKVLIIQSLNGLEESEAKLLGDQGITNLLAAPYVFDASVTSYVGVDNPSQNANEIDVLSTLAYFLMSEVVKRRNDEHRLYTSRYDILSGVLSRNSYVEYVLKTSAESLSSLGIILADINGLKELNSSYGNSYGDSVVKSVAETLKKKFSPESVYRYGGGMFLVLLPDISQESFNLRLTDTRAAFNRVTNYDVSIGSAWSDTVYSIDSLVVKSDEILTADKCERGGIMKAKKDAEKDKMLSKLLNSIDKQEFVPYLQPKVNAETLELSGAEALVRYADAEHGIIPPGRFIPILEGAGLVRYVDFFMFEEVLRIQQKWLREGRALKPLSLNFSRSTMLEPGIVENMLRISQKYDVPKEMLEIEITESLGDLEAETIKRIGGNILRAGYKLSLDDFGAKYSNLAILSWLDFSVLKLDKSLVDHIVSNEMNRSIISSVVDLCQKYKIDVVAEGVESDIQLQELRKLGCGYIQGYLINKPIPISDFEDLYLNKDSSENKN